MKLLFDENLSPKLARLLANSYPGSVHIRDCELTGHSDEEIWEYARKQGFTIVSKDFDFYQRCAFYGHPPKLIWLRLGNCTRDDLMALMKSHEQDIRAFEASNFDSVLVLC